MFWHRLIYALGAMTFACILSEVSLAYAKKLEQSGKFKFIFNILLLIHYFSSIGSFLVGLFLYYHKKELENHQRTIEELTNEQQISREKIDSLSLENDLLQKQLHSDVLHTEKRSHESGYKQGYVNGYSIGFEDCMDILNLEQDRKAAMMPMARQSGIHRIKTRPNIFDNKPATEIGGVLR